MAMVVEDTQQDGSFARCAKHPSQLLNGICSSCLMERLSTVGSSSAERPPPSTPPAGEIVEIAGDCGGGGGGGDATVPVEGKMRKTLLLLFQLDDTSNSFRGESSGSGSVYFDADSDQRGVASGSGDPAMCPKGKGGSASSWLSSILPKKGIRWRRHSKANPPLPPLPQERSVNGNGNADGDRRIEHKPSFRYSCEWMVCREPRGPRRGGAPEPPRHSWDGSMVGKAFACSFACLEERPDGIGRTTRRSMADEAIGGSHGKVRDEERTMSRGTEESGTGWHSRAKSCDDTQPEIARSGISRRRSNRWSKVWDRSITSPLKDFVKKGEHVLERSLSESRKDSWKGKRAETAEIDGRVQAGGTGNGSCRANQGLNRSTYVTNGDFQNFRPDWLRNKECKIGRSRSVHYSSPGNFDNGLLRFYLTPMRSSRSTNRGGRKNSRLFTGGLFGFV